MAAPRLLYMPGVIEWLVSLRDHGPQRRTTGRSGVAARNHGWTDFWVRHVPTGKMMFLETLRAKEKGNIEWYRTVDYGDGEEMITPAGRKALDNLLKMG